MAFNFAQKLKKIFGGKDTAQFFEELAESLIEGDLSAKTAFEIADSLEKTFGSKVVDQEKITAELKKMLLSYVKPITITPEKEKTNIYLILGVNGAGKTTSCAKLAHFYQNRIAQILAACDTFRAAAIEQLKFHGEKLQIRVVAHKDGSDPSAVLFDAAQAASAQNGALVVADTAGRLHNKEHLVRELQKIDRTAQNKASENCYKKILVLDATSGQNALRQAEAFNSAIGVDAVILAKYDSSARGGVAIALGKELGIPVAFVGTGEKYDDFSVFESEKYVNEFLGI